ncbi:MAG TPA: FAD binding domain-containing protein [Nocardioidaceae bacterium]|nr:FAD binding domain-containing protein [Nocardioidaceae bacterium]
MKPAPFAFVRPSSLGEALEALAADANAKVLAGGQSLIPLLSMRLASPSTLVDINGLGLDDIVVTGDGVRIGALVRHAQLERSAEASRVQPLLSRALRLVAHPTIRNRGTTVGSIVHADAAAEMPAVLALLGGSVTAASPRGSRTIPVDALFAGPMESTLAHDEIATEAFFPVVPEGTGVAIDEVSRRHGDYALCGVAAAVTVADGAITSARASYFSVCEVPTVVDLTGVPSDEAGEHALASLDPQGDIHATAEYRRQLVRVLTRRVLQAACDEALAGVGT